MSLGLSFSKSDLDNQAGSLATALRDALRRASDFCDLLQNAQIIPNDQFLLNMGYTQAEVNTLRAAFVSAKALRQLAIGATTQPIANNFLFDLQKLTGPSV